MSITAQIQAGTPREEHCVAIKPGGLSASKQGHHVFEGISAQSAGARALCMHVIAIPPGGRARAHLHEDHESAVYMVEGEVALLVRRSPTATASKTATSRAPCRSKTDPPQQTRAPTPLRLGLRPSAPQRRRSTLAGWPTFRPALPAWISTGLDTRVCWSRLNGAGEFGGQIDWRSRAEIASPGRYDERSSRVSASADFDRAIEASHRALDQIATGDPSGFFELYSQRDDATLANPFGPPARGRDQIEEAGRRAASNYRDGRAIEFENFAKCLTADLAYILEIERFETKVAGSAEVSPVALRVTSIFAPRTERGSFCIGTLTQ